MAKGRKLLPDKVKKLRGEKRPERMQGDPPGEKLTTIDHVDLSVLKTQRAQDIFKQMANYLIKWEILTDANILPLAVYSSNIDLTFTCLDEMQKGLFKERFDENGNVIGFIENPYVNLYNKLQPAIMRQAAEYGFTPVSSLKFARKEEPKDELQALMDTFK